MISRRKFMKISGMTLGIGTLYSVAPPLHGIEGELTTFLGRKSGEKVTPFSFVQLSDAHVGFNGPPDPLGTQAFERAVEMVNALPTRPDLVLFTGDLIHDTEDRDIHVQRIKKFQEIAGRLKVPMVKFVPGEHDAGVDNGQIYHDFFGPSSYSFDHRGVHFIALDNVTRGKPEIGSEQLAWLKKDLARFSKSSPIVVFTHRPLFDLKPEWEWFTSDGDEVMNVLSPYDNVTVLYGHIHRDDEHHIGHSRHLGTRSLIFAFPDPETTNMKAPIPFDKSAPFKNLGIRVVNEKDAQTAPAVKDVELTLREYSGINGIQQIMKEETL